MPLVITNSVGSEVNVHGDRYIYRNGVKYELIRQEGKSTDKMTKGQTVVTYIYRKVEDGSTPSNGNNGQSGNGGNSTSKAVKAASNGSKGSKVLDQQPMALQMVKVQIRRNLETKMVRRQMVLIKLKKATDNCQ